MSKFDGWAVKTKWNSLLISTASWYRRHVIERLGGKRVWKHYKKDGCKIVKIKIFEVKDDLVCSRCGEIFHDSDLKKYPDDYWQCDRCGVIVHAKCRGPILEKSLKKEKSRVTSERVVEIAKKFHEIYERLASSFSYKTRKASATTWENVPIKNKKLMIATVREILDWLEK